MRLLFVGDLHGDLTTADRVITKAKDTNCDEIVQVGDWGFMWPSRNESTELSSMLVDKNIRMRFIDGNHDWHPKLQALRPSCEDNAGPNLTYQHRGTMHEYKDGTRLLFMGGAPSIDRRVRIEHVSWWKEEMITEADVEAALKWKGTPIDVLVTHDSSTHPPGIKETNNMSFNISAQICHAAVDKLIHELSPALHVHGHYHMRYSDKIGNTKVEGLASNIDLFKDLYLIYEHE